MTNQEAFDKVWKHFIVDKNKPSYSRAPDMPNIYRIWYRSPEQAKCAIGVLIPEEKYKQEMEMMELATVLYFSGYDLKTLDAPFFKALQVVHDSVVIYEDFHERFRQALINLAKSFNLTYESVAMTFSEVDEGENKTGL